MEPLVFNGYQESIESFDFREKASIQIPKNVRESAYAFQLDIEILSTDGNDYLNTKSIPAHSFYGYVVLVLRDHSEIQIPIEQPRQTLYYERRPEAYANWYSLYMLAAMSQNLLFISEFQLKPIAEELGLTAAIVPPSCPDWSGFEEIRLREVYVKCRFGTRFKLESTYWSPIPVTYGGCSYDGKSRQIDDDIKDDGLPKDGVQPTNNGDRANPYADYPDPSSSLELDLWDNMGAVDDVDNPNPSNAPEDTTEYLWMFSFLWTVLDNQGNPQDIPCAQIVPARGTAQDSITVNYLDVVGISNQGEPFQRIRLDWKGEPLLTINAGFRNGSVQQCGREIIPE